MLDVAWAPWIGKHHRVASCGTDGRLQVHVLGKRDGTYGEVGGEWDHERSTDLRDGEQKVSRIGNGATLPGIVVLEKGSPGPRHL